MIRSCPPNLFPGPRRLVRAEGDDARRNALDEAIAPLLELAAPLRTGAQRDALAAYVIRKLHSAWNTRNPRAAGNRGTLS